MGKYAMQKEELAKAALNFRDALHAARESFMKEGYPGSVECVDYVLETLKPILDLCIAKEMDEPFGFSAYIQRIMGDHLGFPNIYPYWDHLRTLGRGGLTMEEFWAAGFSIPKQLRLPPEYQPSEAEQERIKKDLMFRRD